MRTLIKLVFLISIIFIQNTFSQSTVYVQTNQFGRGILKMRGSESYVITPEHLLKNYFGPIIVYGQGNERARADLLKSYAGDLAVLQFTGEHNLNSKKWRVDDKFSTIIENVFEGYIELREKDGSSSKVAVSITGIDVQYITIRPKDFREKFYQGMSGSSLFVEYQGKKVLLGMLQSIADDETGSVIRADEMDKLLGSFFNPVKKKKQSNVITDKDLTKEIAGFKFDLLGINKSADKVTFTFNVKSLNKDKVLKLFYRDVSLYDDSGAEHFAKTIIIGNKSSHNVEYNLVKETSVSLKIIFTGISSSAQFATLFKVGFLNEQTKNNFEYRDLYFGDDTEEIQDKGNWEKEELGFKYELLSFEKLGSEVTFNFTITSLTKDKVVKLYYRDIFLYDDKGLESNPYLITIGNKTSHNVAYNLVQGVNVPLKLSFKDVALVSKGVSLLKVGFSDAQNKGVFQIRNLTFPEKKITELKSKVVNTLNNSGLSVKNKTTNCSEIYFYRKNSILECQETVYLFNHGELLAKLQPGIRYKSIVCDDRSFKFSVKTNPNEIALSNSKPVIEMGKKYYLKISCAVGVSTISLQDSKKGEKDIKNNAKFKRKLMTLKLNDY
jgi:hypothetical protein